MERVIGVRRSTGDELGELSLREESHVRQRGVKKQQEKGQCDG